MICHYSLVEPECEEPVSIEAIADYSAGTYIHGDEISYSCPEGFHMFAGTPTRTCLITEFGNASWTGKAPVCLPVGKGINVPPPPLPVMFCFCLFFQEK